MTPPDRILEQVARDRVHAVARQRPSGRPAGHAPDSHAPDGHGHEAWAGRPGSAGGPAEGTDQVHAGATPPDPSIGRRARRHAGTPTAEHATPAGPTPVGDARWTPVRPVDRRPDDDPAPGILGPSDDRGPMGESVADATDVVDVVVRGRAEALAAAAAGYTAAYGHPLDHPGEPAPADGRRWWLSTRHAVVAGIAVAVLAGGVVVRATTQVPDPPVALAAAQAAPIHEDIAGPAGGPAVDGAQPGDDDPVAPGSGTGAATGPGAGGSADPAGLTAASAGPAAASGAPPAAAPGVVVHVVGQVPAPGVLTLPTGSRVSDAVAAAGGPGPEADLSLVNLARVVVDGEQIHVPARGEAVRPPTGTGGSAGPPAAGAAPAPVALNTADLATLDSLPGIGPVLAQRIVDWRADNGPFRSVEELGEVSGIGESLLTRLRPLVRV